MSSYRHDPVRPARVLIVLLVALSLVLAACGGDDDDEAEASTADESATDTAQTTATTAAEPSDGEAVEITFWHMPNGADPQAAIQAEIDAFQQEHPNITIKPEMVDWTAAFTRIQTAVQGGEGPCITQLGTTWVPGFSAMGGLRPFMAEEIQAVGGESAFIPTSWATSGLAGSSDVTAMPWFADIRAVAYRKDLLEQAGLTPEEAFKDMESWIEAMQAIKEATGVDPFVHPGKQDWNVWQNSSMFIWAYDGDILAGDGTEAVFNSPEAVEGVTTFASFYGMELTPEDTLELNSAQVEQRFGDGQAAMMLTGPWVISNARASVDEGGWANEEAKQNMAFAEFPAGPGGQYTFIGGSNLAILESCEHPEAAVEFVAFLLSKDSQVRYGQAIGMMPVTVEGQQDPAFTDDPLFAVFLDAAAKGKTSPAIPKWGSVEPAFQEQLQAVWEDVAASGRGNPIRKEQVQERLDAAAEAVDSLLQ